MRTIIVDGRIAADAEVKMPNESTKKCVEFRIASNEFYDGENNTHWFRVRSHNERDIKLAPYLKKGKPIYVNGQLKAAAYINRENKAAISLDIEANRIDFINYGEQRNEGQSANTAAVTETKTPTSVTEAPAPSTLTTGELPTKKTKAKSAPAPAPVASEQTDGDDDLPF